MTPSDDLIAFIKGWESLRLKAYDDGGGVWTIGYGHIKQVQPGDECTEAQAEAWLRDEVDDVSADIDPLIHVMLAQHEHDSLVSLAFNIGVGAFAKSTLLSRLNNSDFGSAADEFLRWNRDNGRIVQGLVKRRKAERAMFLDSDYSGRP